MYKLCVLLALAVLANQAHAFMPLGGRHLLQVPDGTAGMDGVTPQGDTATTDASPAPANAVAANGKFFSGGGDSTPKLPIPEPERICGNVINALVSVDGRKGCKRFTQGFDVTGVTNFAQFPVRDECECIAACLKNKEICDNWVWKLTDATGKRTCTLYSNFNMPPKTNLVIAGDATINPVGGPTGTASLANPFTQNGGLVPFCTQVDAQGNPTDMWDRGCKSGQLFFLDTTKLNNGGAGTKHFISC